MAQAEEVESRVLKRCSSQLENAFESDSDLAHYLNSEGYLKDDDYEKVISPSSSLSKKEKASILVGGIKNKVALNSNRYHEFVKHLRLNTRKYGDIVDILDSTYEKAQMPNLVKDHISRGLSDDRESEQKRSISNSMETSSSFDLDDITDIDIAALAPALLETGMNKYNITVVENHGLNESTGFWWLRFTFDYKLEKSIEVRLTNFKYPRCQDWTLEVTKCNYLGIHDSDQMESFDMADEFINATELSKLVGSKETLWKYLEQYIVPLVTKKIKYTKYKPQFRFYLSHFSEDIPFMRTFENGFKFLGYGTWLKESVKPFGNILAGMKAAIDGCDCFLPWIDEKYMRDENCRAELLYAHKSRRIILPFGDSQTVDRYFKGNFLFMKSIHIYNPVKASFFEVLQHIDDTLFNFEDLVL